MKTRVVALGIMIASVTVVGMAAGETPAAGKSVALVVNPHLKTDKSVDTSSIDAILADLIKKDMTDEQKVLACFNWIRRLLYHGDGPADLSYNFHNMINIMGNGSCLRQTSPLAELLKRLGYEVESWGHQGHHMMQVKYSGQWHCLDPHMCFYVYDRSAVPVLASIEQLQNDPTLALDAVKENRACPGYLLCGDGADIFAGKEGNWVKEGPFHKLVIDEPFGNISLPRGTTYVRTWMPDEYWFKRGSFMRDSGPFHGCSRKDARDTVNWPLFEPHGAKFQGRTSFRHWSAGRIVYKPDLRTDHYLDAALSQFNLQVDAAKGLVALDPAAAAELVLGVNCPYAITASDLLFPKPAQGSIVAAVSADNGKTWKPMELAQKDAALAAIAVDEVNGSFEGYQLRLTLQGGAAVEWLQLTSHFQINMYSLPYLAPGDNVVDVNAEAFGSPLTVCWQYAEGPEWKEVKETRQEFLKSGQFTIAVGGEKYPRNVALTLSVAP